MNTVMSMSKSPSENATYEDLFKIASTILVQFPSSFFSRVQVVQLYNSTDMTTAPVLFYHKDQISIRSLTCQ